MRCLIPGLTCVVRGVDQSGFKLLTELRDRHLKRVLYLPAVLSLYHKALPTSSGDSELSEDAKSVLRTALGVFTQRKLEDSLQPVEVRTLPTKKKLFSVLKSPHVDKKALEQFFYTTYGAEMTIKTNSVSALVLTETLARLYETGSNELHITARF
eukprot:g7647.t1